MEQMTIEKKSAVKNGVGRMAFALLSILLEIAFIMWLVYGLRDYATWASIVFRVLAAVFVLFIYGRHTTSSLKMPWIVLILAMPVFGFVMYLLVGLNKGTRKMRKRYKEVDEKLLPLLPANDEAFLKLKQSDPSATTVVRWYLAEKKFL